MAKKSMVAREQKKLDLINKYRDRRTTLKQIIKSSNDVDEIMEAQFKLANLPVNSSSVRYTTRCQQCGRPHGVYSKFELCRICLRKELMNGNVTGGRKSSW